MRRMNYQTLFENFEFEYIFSFLAPKEIVSAQKISKLFQKELTKDDFWEDISQIHFNQKVGYKTSLELCQTNSIYIFGYKAEIFTNLSFFNEKRVRKIAPSSYAIFVLTGDGKLYLRDQKDGKQHLFNTPTLIKDVACGTSFEDEFPKVVVVCDNGKSYALLEKEGEWK